MDIFETLTINGRKYKTRKLSARAAMSMHALTVSTFGRNAQEIINTVDIPKITDGKSIESSIKGESGELVIKAGISAFIGLIGRADPDRLVELEDAVLGEISPEGGELLRGHQIDLHFDRYPEDIYPVILWGLLLNISPFLSGAGSGLISALSALGLESQEDTKSFGSSTVQSGRGQSPQTGLKR